VGDFFDAMAGYNERDNERVKLLAEIVRTSTSILWNIQVPEESKTSAEDLWKFPWDKKPVTILDKISEQERSVTDKKLEEAVLRHGNRNKQP
jgi:hypothetical protein